MQGHTFKTCRGTFVVTAVISISLIIQPEVFVLSLAAMRVTVV